MLRRVVRGILIWQRPNKTRVELWGSQVPDWKEQDCGGFTVSNNEGSSSSVYKSVDCWLVSAELAYDSVYDDGTRFSEREICPARVTV